jgi:CDGSH iron-sulfur domain-containing protein 3
MVRPAMTTVRLRRNGPYVIEGEGVRVVDCNGVEVQPSRLPIALCRCGASQQKPLCDGSHARVGFYPDGDPPSGPLRHIHERPAED